MLWGNSATEPPCSTVTRTLEENCTAVKEPGLTKVHGVRRKEGTDVSLLDSFKMFWKQKNRVSVALTTQDMTVIGPQDTISHTQTHMIAVFFWLSR